MTGNNRSTFSSLKNNGVSRGQNAREHSDSTRPTVWRPSQGRNLRLMGSSATRKLSNEHGFFVTITFLNKIGEERIRDLTDDVLFPVTFKCALLIVIKKDPRPHLCSMSNNVLMCIENRADLPRPWTEVLTPQVVTNRTNRSFHVYLNGRNKDAGISTNDMATTCKKDNTIVSNLKIAKLLKLRCKVHLRTASNDYDAKLSETCV